MAADSLILGRYRLDREIAVGGTARVWQATDCQEDRPVAVKLLHPHLLPDATSRRRLEGEAHAAETLSHPGIAALYDVSGPDDDPALVMELVHGEPLSRMLERDGPMPPRAAAALVADVAEALYHAHQQGIVHRDVKPANILVEHDGGRARLIDFGIAHSLEVASHDLTRTGTALGTPRYMAPEQLAGEAIGPRTDLWGLGAVLYQALSGRVPFDGATPVAIAAQQQAGPPPLDADPALAAVVAACLSVPIEDRPVHAGAVGLALRDWLDGDPSSALAMAPAASAATKAAPAVRPVPVARPRPRPAPGVEVGRRARSPVLAIAGILVVGLVLAALALAVSGGLLPLVGADASASPTAAVTPVPTPNWKAPLLAAYRDACGVSLDRSELQGLSRADAEALVAAAVSECQDPGDGHAGKGNGHGGHGHGKGGGKGHD